MRRYAIIGHPVSQSLSPQLHNAAFEALGMDCRYEAIDIDPGELKDRVEELKSRQFSGFNVTVPYKEAIIPLLDGVDEIASRIGAVNTVVKTSSGYRGHNTDVHGFRSLLHPFERSVNGLHVCVLGAGGAARAVLFGLTTGYSPKQITILNRTLEKAEALVTDFSHAGILLKAEPLFQEGLEGLLSGSALIINTTSVGMKPFTDTTPLDGVKFRKDQVVIDLIYIPSETTLLKEAKHAGATVVNGFEMWMAQAMEAFRLWTGKEMPEEARESVGLGNSKDKG